jgi:hypothetical protein
MGSLSSLLCSLLPLALNRPCRSMEQPSSSPPHCHTCNTLIMMQLTACNVTVLTRQRKLLPPPSNYMNKVMLTYRQQDAEQSYKRKRYSYPITSLNRPWGFQEVEVPRLLALCTSQLYPLGNIPGTHFCKRLGPPQSQSAAEKIMSMKHSTDTIRNWTHDLPACSAVLLHAPWEDGKEEE